MTVVELAQCIFWGFFGMVPLLLAASATQESDDVGKPILWFAAAIGQVAIAIACFKAGIQQ